MKRREDAGPTRHVSIAALFLVAAIVLGGGGSPNPTTELLLQLTYSAAALAWLWMPGRESRPRAPESRSFWLICGLVLAVPVLQLVPLPPGLWRALDGQADRTAALALVGKDLDWQPLSRSPARTVAGLLAIIPALFAFFATTALDARGRHWVVGTIAALALATALFGALQVSMGPNAPYFYAENHRTLTGFQANRNAAADILLIGIAAGAAFLAPSLAAASGREAPLAGAVLTQRRVAALVLAGVVIPLFFATILTFSRTGIALLPVALAGAWVIVLPALAGLGRWRLVPPAVVVAMLPAAALVALAGGNTTLGAVAERFVFADDARRELWRDAWFATAQAWPFGVGLGGSQPAVIAAERLEVLGPTLPNRVHNDYLEFALEGGLLAVVVLGGIVFLLFGAAWRSWRDRPAERHMTTLGVVILLIAALHSFVDYPLRSMALACLVGTGAGLLMVTPRRLTASGSSA